MSDANKPAAAPKSPKEHEAKPAAAPKSKGPVTYKAPHEVYTGGKLYLPGQPFTTSETKGREWEWIGATEKAAAIAADPQRHDDADLTKLDVGQLKAVAAARNIETGEADSEDDLIAIINAASDATR